MGRIAIGGDPHCRTFAPWLSRRWRIQTPASSFFASRPETLRETLIRCRIRRLLKVMRAADPK